MIKSVWCNPSSLLYLQGSLPPRHQTHQAHNSIHKLNVSPISYPPSTKSKYRLLYRPGWKAYNPRTPVCERKLGQQRVFHRHKCPCAKPVQKTTNCIHNPARCKETHDITNQGHQNGEEERSFSTKEFSKLTSHQIAKKCS